ncbi:hypothetical protein KAU32_01340 [bacterium]|nr:hypothetical protein [bacterium]
MTFGPINIVNIVLCIIIVVMGFMKYGKEKAQLPLLIGIAFGLFGLSHIAKVFELSGPWDIPLIIIRTIAYLTVVYALIAKKK